MQLIPAFLEVKKRDSARDDRFDSRLDLSEGAGAQILITDAGEPIGLLSGGCLEGDLTEQARSVFETGEPKMRHYDDAGDDEVFGSASAAAGASTSG